MKEPRSVDAAGAAVRRPGGLLRAVLAMEGGPVVRADQGVDVVRPVVRLHQPEESEAMLSRVSRWVVIAMVLSGIGCGLWALWMEICVEEGRRVHAVGVVEMCDEVREPLGKLDEEAEEAK
jgi:hypothetical protein